MFTNGVCSPGDVGLPFTLQLRNLRKNGHKWARCLEKRSDLLHPTCHFRGLVSHF